MAQTNTESRRVALITGVSSGFGRACAFHLSRTGYRVYGTSRSATFDPAPKSSGPDESFFRMIPMDVRGDASVAEGISIS